MFPEKSLTILIILPAAFDVCRHVRALHKHRAASTRKLSSLSSGLQISGEVPVSLLIIAPPDPHPDPSHHPTSRLSFLISRLSPPCSFSISGVYYYNIMDGFLEKYDTDHRLRRQ